MLSLLETGRALYVLVGICVLGVLTRLQTQNLYKRLIRESSNLAGARNKGLKELRQRAENAFHVNQGMRDPASWLEHQLGDLRFRGLTLGGWANLSMRLTWLCLLLGGAAAFFSYWYQLDTYYIVMYGGGAVLMAMATMLPDGNSYLSRREQFLAALQDHLENSMFPRLERAVDRAGGANREPGRTTVSERGQYAAPASGAAVREAALTREAESQEEPVRMTIRGAAARGSLEPGDSEKNVTVQERSRLSARQLFAERPGRSRRRERMPAEDASAGSQEQTAAAAIPPVGSQDTGNTKGLSESEERNWLKELGPEEARVIGDILKHYLT